MQKQTSVINFQDFVSCLSPRHFSAIVGRSISDMTRKDHLVYWALPAVTMTVLMYFYFSGIDALVHVVCPPGNWEWGILENLQLVFILLIAGLAIYAYRNSSSVWISRLMLLIALFTAFIFLEEIDYGAHFNELFYGTNTSYLGEITGYYNIHNEGNNARLFKRSVYLLMALIFVTLPLFYYVDKQPDWLRYFIPHPKIIILALLTILVDIAPRLLIWSGLVEDGGLGVNIGEFSEVMVYYIFLVYLHQLVIKQQKAK